MLKLLKTKKFLAAIGSLVALGIVLTAVLTLSKGNKNTPETTPTPTQAVDMTDYKEVRFALPNGVSELDAENTRLPETAMIPKGTKIADLASPRQPGKVFLGWYYDNNLTLMTGPEDTIENNLTLYPRFGKRQDTEDIFSYDFVASEDVPEDFAIFVAGHNLSAEKVKELLAVRNVSLGDEAMKFTLKEVKKAEAAKEEEGEEDPDEAELRKLFEMAGVNIDAIEGVPDLYIIYGLEEDDSPARYWREELGLDPETVLALQAAYESMQKAAWENVTVYQVIPEGGTWTEGQLQQVEILDSSNMRFLVNEQETGKDIVFYNFSVSREEYNNLTVNSDVKFIPLADVTGISELNALYKVSEDGSTLKKNEAGGSFVYKKGTLAPGTTVAIYDGTLGKDGRVDGEVGYYRIRESLGDGKYTYGGAEFTDVLFLPDVIPVKDDGTFQDGSVRLDATVLSFNGAAYSHLRLGKNTKVEPGDYLYFYTGNAKAVKDLNVIGVGRVTSVAQDGKNLIVKYEVSSKKEVENYGMHEQIGQIPIPLDTAQKDALSKNVLEKMEQSAFAEITGEYVLGILNGDVSFPDDPDMADALKNMKFKTEDGGEITVEELKLLAANPSKVSVTGKDVKVKLSTELQHFSGYGARVEISAGFKITIKLNGNNALEIQVDAAFEQEIMLGAHIDAYFNLFDLDNTSVDLSLRAGTFTGFGAQATVMTVEKKEENSDWARLLKETGAGSGTTGASKNLLNMAESLGKLKDGLEKVQGGGTYAKGKGPGALTSSEDYEGAEYMSAGGDLPTKYKAMLENKAEYIDLVDVQLFQFDFRPPGPLAVIDFSIQGDLVLQFKVNAMLGFSISHGNAKQLCYHIEPFHQVARSSTADIEAPNFRVDFFVFGMLGVRAGVKLDGRVGILSTAFDSIGITAEVGLYAEVYGFLYMFYSWESIPDSKEGKIEKGIMGSLLFELGSYLEINFVAQLGDGQLEKEIKIYEKKWPLVQLGATEVPVPFKDSQEELQELGKMLEIGPGESTVKVPDVVFNVDMMAMDSGEVTRESQDSDKLGEGNYSFYINGRKYEQYNEEHFDVTCYDLDGENGKLTENHSFQYLPATNEIYVKPVNDDVDELWGIVTFTYRNNSFGFSTMEFKRSLKVHWKGERCTGVVEYYLQKPGASNLDALLPDKINTSYELIRTGEFDAFNGIEYDLIVTDTFVNQYPGYTLYAVDYPGIGTIHDQVEEAEKNAKRISAEYKAMKATPDKYTYNQFKAKSDQETDALADWDSKRKAYEEYYTNILNSISQKDGTLHFKVVKNATVVRLYFDIVEYDVTMLRVTDKAGNDTTTKKKFIYGNTKQYDPKSVKRGILGNDLMIRKDTNLLEKAQELTKDYDPELDLEFYVFYPNLRSKYYRIGTTSTIAKVVEYSHPINVDYFDPDYIKSHASEWVPLTVDLKMPEDNIVIIAVEKKTEKEFTVTWTDDYGVPIREDKVVFDEPLPEAPYTAKREKEGYTATLSWKDDQDKTVTADYKMPARDITVSANWTFKPLPQPITWEALGFTWKTDGPGIGEVIYLGNAVYAGNQVEAFKKANGRDELSLYKTGYTTDITVVLPDGTAKPWTQAEHIMPAGGVTLRFKFTPNKYKVTWMDGDKVVKEETVTYGETYHFPKVPVDEDEVLSWAYDYYNGTTVHMFDGYKVVNRDIVARTVRHKHQWDDGKIISEGSCGRKGWTQYTCKSCGEKVSKQDRPIIPDNHEKYLYSSTEATCCSAKTETYRCLGCGGEWKVTIGEKNASFHRSYELSNHTYKREEAEIPATCVKEGRTTAYYCYECDALLEGGQVIPKGDHEWLETVYKKSTDGKSVTASHVCKNDSSHTETENATASPKVVKNATCTEKGKREYTATFRNKAFAAYTYYEDIEMIAHNWGTPTYTWSTDKRSVTATRVCSYDTNRTHTETESAAVTTSVKKPASTTETGILLYKAVFNNPAFGTWEKEEIIPIEVCTHNWVDKTDSAWVEIKSGETTGIIHPGTKYQVCTKCKEKKAGSEQDAPIIPTLKVSQAELYSHLESQYIEDGLGNVPVYQFFTNLNPAFDVVVTLPTAADGTGSCKVHLRCGYLRPAEETADYNTTTLADLDTMFQNGTATSYTIKVKFVAGFDGVPEMGGSDPDNYSLRLFGYNDDLTVALYGQQSYIKGTEMNFVITSDGHKHSWKTVTEAPYFDTTYSTHCWREGSSYEECEHCGIRKNVKAVKLIPYLWDEVKEQRIPIQTGNVYEVRLTAKQLEEVFDTWRSLINADPTVGYFLGEVSCSRHPLKDFITFYYSEDGSRNPDKNYASDATLLTNATYTLPDGVTAETRFKDLTQSVTVEYTTYPITNSGFEKVKVRIVILPGDGT